MKRHRYCLTLESEPGLTTEEATRYLRACLKMMLRSYGFKCSSASPIEPAGDETTAQDKPQQAKGASDEDSPT